MERYNWRVIWDMRYETLPVRFIFVWVLTANLSHEIWDMKLYKLDLFPYEF